MTFAKNVLRVVHEKNFGFQFTCLDALKLVKKLKPGEDMKVGVADAWQGARTDCEFSKRILKPFDWTFCTDYHGTLLPEDSESEHSDERFQIVDTDERIDMDKLKKKDEILFYENIDLFEDELADHGIAQFSAKIVSDS